MRPLDRFRSINDNYGHATGDAFLIAVAESIRDSVRDSDICARLGGDEFLIFSCGCDLDAATEIARRVLNSVHARSAAPDRPHFGVSIGIDVAAPGTAAFDAMYRRADRALYQAKASGRNRYVIFDPIAAA